MQKTLTIKDLPARAGLDQATMSSIRGGQDNQANGTSQANAQQMAAAANIGNGSIVMGPATIQADASFSQDAYNTSYSSNFDVTSLGYYFDPCQR